MKDIIQKAIDSFGYENQLIKAKEELAELIVAICKGDIDNILEEITDVEIMLEQLKLIYDITPDMVKRIKEQKIARLALKINDYYNINPDKNNVCVFKQKEDVNNE